MVFYDDPVRPGRACATTRRSRSQEEVDFVDESVGVD